MIIECDGATYHGSTEAYAYDYFRMKQLQENGYVVHKIWSTNWWDEEEYKYEIEKLKRLFDEYDCEPKVNDTFYKPSLSNQGEPQVNIEIRNLVQNEFEENKIVTGFTIDPSTDEESGIEEDLSVKTKAIKLHYQKIDNKKRNSSQNSIYHQSSLFSPSSEKIATNKDLWFKLSHWGKETGKLNGFQNRACYSLGMYIGKNKHLTVKQEIYGKKLFELAVSKGFIY